MNYLDKTGLTYLVSKLKTMFAAKNHTHNYAGSSSAGGAATSSLTCTGNAASATTAATCTGNSATATALGSSAGSTTQPVYFANGKPVNTGFSVATSVPAGAKFTDTTYGVATQSANGLMSASDKKNLDTTVTKVSALDDELEDVHDIMSNGGIESVVGNPVTISTRNVDSNAKSFTIDGKTTQAGSGDPSPTNIRAIDGVGKYDKSVTLNGSETWVIDGKGESMFFYCPNGMAGHSGIYDEKSSYLKFANITYTTTDEGVSGWEETVYIRNHEITTVSDFKAYLANKPLTLWYKSTNYVKSTTYYTVEETTGADGSYHAQAVKLTSPLYDGDVLDMAKGSVTRNYKRIVFTGDEAIEFLQYGGYNLFYYSIKNNHGYRNIICSHFKTSQALTNDSLYMSDGAVDNYLRIQFRCNEYSSVEEFKQFLKENYNAGTPVTVVYELATPITETTTGTTIPVQTGDSISAENTIGAVYGNGLTTELANKADKSEVAKKLDKTSVINNLTTSASGSALDASQGKALKDSISNLTTAVGTWETVALTTYSFGYFTGAVNRTTKIAVVTFTGTGTVPPSEIQTTLPDGFKAAISMTNPIRNGDYISVTGNTVTIAGSGQSSVLGSIIYPTV